MKSWIILFFLAFVWGSSYILMKKGLLHFEPMQLAGFRMLISGLFFLPFMIANGRQVNWQNWKYYLIVGLCGSGIPAVLFAFAQTRLNSSLTGILSSLTPLFTLLVGLLFFKSPVEKNKAIGVLIGLIGASLLILYGGEGNNQMGENLLYGSLVVFACFLYAYSSNTVKFNLPEEPSFFISTVAFMYLIPLGAIILYTSKAWEPFATPGAWTAFGAIATLAIFGTVVASVLFFHLVQIRDAIFASMVSYLIPLVAILWGIFDGEKITYIHAVGMILILVGVFFSRQKNTT